MNVADLFTTLRNLKTVRVNTVGLIACLCVSLLTFAHPLCFYTWHCARRDMLTAPTDAEWEILNFVRKASYVGIGTTTFVASVIFFAVLFNLTGLQ